MPFHTEIKSADELKAILRNNSSWVVLKFSATWCGPCKKVEPITSPWLQRLAEKHIDIYILDIDENFEIYGYLKNKRRINGIPAMLAYKKGNVEITPDLFISGTQEKGIHDFFTRILQDE